MDVLLSWEGIKDYVNIADQYRRTPLSLAIYKGDVEAVKRLLALGATIDFSKVIHYNGLTLLNDVLINCSSEMVQSVLGWEGIKDYVNIKDKHGHTPLQEAIIKQNVNAVTRLLALGATTDFSITLSSGLTLLNHVLTDCSAEMVQSVLGWEGIKDYVNLEDGLKQTPLYIACVKGNVDTISKLLKAGADIKGKDKTGEPILNTALGMHIINNPDFDAEQVSTRELLSMPAKNANAAVQKYQPAFKTMLGLFMTGYWFSAIKMLYQLVIGKPSVVKVGPTPVAPVKPSKARYSMPNVSTQYHGMQSANRYV